jgi:hypothetical protein
MATNAPELEPTSGVTVSAWIERDGSPGIFRYVLAKGATGCIAASYGLYWGALGGLEFYVSRHHGSVYATSPDAGATVWDGRWHLVVGTFDGTTIRLYVDGRRIGAGTVYPGALEYDLYIGGYTAGRDRAACQAKNFTEEIADVQIWDRALTADEVSAMAEPSQQPPLPSGNGSISQINTGGGAGAPALSVAEAPSASGAAVGSPPVLRALKLLRTPLSSRAVGRSRITYTDSRSATVTFTILTPSARSGCTKPKPGTDANGSPDAPATSSWPGSPIVTTPAVTGCDSRSASGSPRALTCWTRRQRRTTRSAEP